MSGRNQDHLFEASWKLCVLISLLLHLGGIGLLSVVPLPEMTMDQRKGGQSRSMKVAVSPSMVKKVPLKDRTQQEDAEEEDKKRRRRFVKTSAEQETQEELKKSSFVGERRTKASGGPKAPDDIREMPAQDGIEPRFEGDLILFDQDRQDGDLEHEKKGNPSRNPRVAVQRIIPRREPSQQEQPIAQNQQQVQAIPSLQQPIFPVPPTQTADLSKADPALKDRPSDQSQADSNRVDTRNNTPQDIKTPEDVSEMNPQSRRNSRELAARENTTDGETAGEGTQKGALKDVPRRQDSRTDSNNRNESKFDRKESLAELIGKAMEPMASVMHNERMMPMPKPEASKNAGGGAAPMPAISPSGASGAAAAIPLPVEQVETGSSKAQKRVYYDPAFAPDSQPGFRTFERKTKTSGRFSFGHRASMDVDATPTGRYMAMVYRAIAISWYAQCDRNRDMIVTGTVHIRIWLDDQGKIVSIRELAREGASVAQKSFTFVAIQEAPIPPMPPDVRDKLIGGKMELYFDFFF